MNCHSLIHVPYIMKSLQEKSLVFITACVFILGLSSPDGLCSANDTGPEEMELRSPAGIRSARFPHKKHQKIYKCKECHHAKADDNMQAPYVEGMAVRRCITCHNPEDMANLKLNSFKLAAHGSCKECHKKNKAQAPTKCSGCHIK